ncbi:MULTISPECIES: serine hydrolase [Halolamina]|uniref:CubicO group peptidase, beta-lactamase class C family n=1 Tax=Halolamina pelagica TaxID=699431 RepID=A0A1I5SZQ2_9EURY|nr:MULTISPECIES: serine hydrolase [Halolamina]NHX36931.1 serine hydrolase [Halolamina sp. R1-12]SFP76091.1 CubicO group peptidase, beta-lactamase class C family [Halolamina pelagica]
MSIADDASEIARLCRRVVRDETLPGLSVAVTDADGTVYAEGFGSRDLAGNRPATPETLYGIASCTKSFAGVAVLQLVESGICDLDDPISAYLPVEFDEPEPTIHHLLTHSSGLPSLGVSETLLARRLRLPDPGIAMGDVDDFYAHVNAAGAERVDPPGERFAYCNTGYALLGEAVESMTGKPFDEYVTEHVFEPLGMDRSTFDDHEFSMADDHMTQYRQTDEGLMASSLPTRDIGQATGGILASVSELAGYLRLHLNGGEAAGERLLDADTLARAHEGYVDVPGRSPDTEGADRQYGYGWFRDEGFLGDRTLLGHSGSITVSSAYLGFLPDEQVGVALASNTSPAFPLGAVGEGVLAAVLGEDPESVPFVRLRRRHRRLAGEYAAYEGVMSATVERDGGSLRVDFDHPLKDGETVLFPAPEEGENERADAAYRYETVDSAGRREPVEFRVEDGEVSLLIDRWRLGKQ